MKSFDPEALTPSLRENPANCGKKSQRRRAPDVRRRVTLWVTGKCLAAPVARAQPGDGDIHRLTAMNKRSQ